MARMGRHRASNPLGLPDRVYSKHGAFYYVTRAGKWERLGTDLKAAIAEGNRRNADTDLGLVNWWWAEWKKSLAARIGKPKSAKGISQRTHDDYMEAGDYLLPYFGKMPPADITPVHVGQYLDDHAAAGRPVRANREKAALSAFLTWLVRQDGSGVAVNPCFGVRRNPEFKRERYVEDAEYQAVWKLATPQVRALLDLVYRTLQRPEDVITWTMANLRTKDGKRCIFNRHQKTGADVWIELDPTLDAILKSAWGAKGPRIGVTILRPRPKDGIEAGYTYDGLSSMLKRYQAKVRKDGGQCQPFGFYDMKAKGATDMFLAGVPLETIQALCGHDSVTTTEIYVKCRIRSVVAANQVEMRA